MTIEAPRLEEGYALEPVTEAQFRELRDMVEVVRGEQLEHRILRRQGQPPVTLYLANGELVAAARVQGPVVQYYRRIV